MIKDERMFAFFNFHIVVVNLIDIFIVLHGRFVFKQESEVVDKFRESPSVCKTFLNRLGSADGGVSGEGVNHHKSGFFEEYLGVVSVV